MVIDQVDVGWLDLAGVQLHERPSTVLPPKKYIELCASCGGAGVSCEFSCDWSVEKQEWVVGDYRDDSTYCYSCGETRSGPYEYDAESWSLQLYRGDLVSWIGSAEFDAICQEEPELKSGIVSDDEPACLPGQSRDYYPTLETIEVQFMSGEKFRVWPWQVELVQRAEGRDEDEGQGELHGL